MMERTATEGCSVSKKRTQNSRLWTSCVEFQHITHGQLDEKKSRQKLKYVGPQVDPQE